MHMLTLSQPIFAWEAKPAQALKSHNMYYCGFTFVFLCVDVKEQFYD
jgi:hypothetical protein